MSAMEPLQAARKVTHDPSHSQVTWARRYFVRRRLRRTARKASKTMSASILPKIVARENITLMQAMSATGRTQTVSQKRTPFQKRSSLFGT